MGSSGGGSSRPPNQATPSGMITDYGSATPWAPSYNSVLPDSGWATVEGTEGANAANAARAAAAPPPPPADSGMGGFGNSGYARQLLASMMNPTPAIGNDKAMAIQRMMSMPGFQMSGGNPFAPAPLPKPGAGASPSDQLLYQLANRNSGGGSLPQQYTGRSAASFRR